MTQNAGHTFCRVGDGTNQPPGSGRMQEMKIAGVHRPAKSAYLISPLLPKLGPLLFFFFILTLIGYTWIMKQGYQCDRPALHIAEPVILNCPSGPFRSEFLMSKQTTLFRCDRCFSSDMEMKNL